jgi:hypothetical protein
MRIFFIFNFILFSIIYSNAQTLQGHIFGPDNEQIMFANVYVKYSSNGTSCDDNGYYFLQFKEPGVYQIVVSSVGYQTKEIEIVLKNNIEKHQDIWLEFNENELDEFIVNSKGKDPAYEIIDNTIKNKSKWNHQYNSLSNDVYIKAIENISEKERKIRASQERKKKKEQTDLEKFENNEIAENKTDQRKNKVNEIAASMNMIEVQLTRHYKHPYFSKEIRTGYKEYGNTEGLCFTNTVENVFNYYDNLIKAKNINESPIISPLHTTSILSYKFKLLKTTQFGKHLLHEIKITPRKKGNATWEGKIWIIDKLFCIYKTDLKLNKSGLVKHNYFRLEQKYKFTEDSILVINNQNFYYSSIIGKQKLNGKTSVTYSNYKFNPIFPDRYFNNELGVTTKEAYERDSTYWNNIRITPLTKEERIFQFIKDSIENHITSESYLDSLDSVYNRITLVDIIWDGPGISNRKKKQYFSFTSIAGLIDPFEIGGIRIGPDLSYFKKWENEKTFWFYANGNFGIRNPDFKYMYWMNHRYDPKHLGNIGFYIGDQNELIVENDAVTNLFQRSNWIREFNVVLEHSRELLNGLYVDTYVNWIERNPITSYSFNPEADDWFDGNHPIDFNPYQEFVMNIDISFVPFQKYMSEPYRKVVLGSKWPRFSLFYEKGIPDILESDVDFDFLTARIDQSFKLRTLGTSNYKIEAGKFLRNIQSYYADYKIFPRGDQWFFASLMESMQIQDTTLSVTDSYLKLNYAHHFDGAIINYIPIIKKLGIHTVIGGSTLNIPESSYSYQEVFCGIERTFRIQRSRLRLGIYYVDAWSSHSSIKPRIKFAINRYNYRDQTWSY